MPLAAQRRESSPLGLGEELCCAVSGAGRADVAARHAAEPPAPARQHQTACISELPKACWVHAQDSTQYRQSSFSWTMSTAALASS